MTEKQLGQALLDLDLSAASGGADPRQLTQKILDRDQRRVRRWTWATIILWVLAALMVLWMLVAMALLMPRHAHLFQAIQQGSIDQVERERVEMEVQIFAYMITVGITGSVGVLGLAALCTVFLVLASRRATLRQINASLLEISEQLRQLRVGPAA